MMRKIYLYLILSAFLTGAAAAQSADDNWLVNDATVRFNVALRVKPSHSSAGYYIAVPDGGTLPTPRAEPVVYDESGTLLKSAVLWHCKDTECAMVFETPNAGESVTIYFRGVQKQTLWTPQSGITPSAIVCQMTGTRDKNSVLKLGNFGQVGSNAHFVNQAWTAGNWRGNSIPLALWERHMGNGSVMYLLAHINVTAPGSTWIGPHYRSGDMEVAVDSKMLKQSKKNNKVGGVGAMVELTEGVHRVELYGYSRRNTATGPMMFAWRTPKTSIDQLGGPRPPDLPYPGTSMGETCSIDSEDVLKSGVAFIRGVSSRSGVVASFILQSAELYAFPDEANLLAYRLNAVTEGNPENAVYTWKIEQDSDAQPQGSELCWLFRDGKYTRVTLTVEADRKRASSSMVFLPYTEDSSDMQMEQTRQTFKLACYHMIRAYPERIDPFAKWDDAMWNNFFRVQELKGGNALIEYMVSSKWDFLKKQLSPERKALVQDIFMFTLSALKPREAIKWAATFGADEFSSARSALFKLRTAEIMLYYLDDPDGARRIITPLLQDSGEGGELAKLKMGDLEFITGNLNAAIQRYGDVQSRAKAEAQQLVSKYLQPISAGPTRAARDSAAQDQGVDAAQSKFVPIDPPSDLPPWKLAAIREVAASENIAVLLEQGFYLEAYQAMQLWERAFPMAKINGDYILREADLYMRMGDFKRARIILSAYCEQVDVSNFLPQAMQMVKRCMQEMKEPEAAIEKYEKEIMRRTAFGGAQPE